MVLASLSVALGGARVHGPIEARRGVRMGLGLVRIGYTQWSVVGSVPGCGERPPAESGHRDQRKHKCEDRQSKCQCKASQELGTQRR